MVRVGVDEDGERNVLGERLTFVERIHHNGLRVVPTLLDGYPLVPAVPVLSAAAFNMAIRGRENFWDGLKWLCLLNEIDAPGVTSALRRHAVALQARPAEDGVHPELAARIAALVLWLSGDEELEAEAVATDPGLDRGPDYQAEYLAAPGRSFFSLQRRHAPQVAGDTTLPLARRIDKVSPFQVDPGLDLPEEFVSEVRDGLAGFDVSELDSCFGRTVEDGRWEDIEPVLARAAPDLLAELVRRKLGGLVDRESDKRRIGLSRSTADFLLADRLSDVALTALEASEATEDGDDAENGYARSRALLIAAVGLPPVERVAFLLDRDADLYSNLAEVLAPLDPVEVDKLVERYGDGPKAGDLVRLLSLNLNAYVGARGTVCLNAIRRLCNVHRMALLGFGTAAAMAALQGDEQLENRFETFELRPLSPSEFGEFIELMSGAMPLRQPTSWSVHMLERAYELTSGYVGRASYLVQEASVQAVLTGSEQITGDILESRELSNSLAALKHARTRAGGRTKRSST